MMSIQDVKRRVEVIKFLAGEGDHRLAHREEKSLYQDVLEAMFHTANFELAEEALKAKKVEFDRWLS